MATFSNINFSHFTFDDVLLKPKYSIMGSRRNTNVSTTLNSRLSLRLPIVSANMDTVTGPEMARTIAGLGGLAILHRFCSVEDNVNYFLDAVRDSSVDRKLVGVSIGISRDEATERAKALANAGATTFCIDIAHGAQSKAVSQYRWLRESYPDAFIIVGNFGTAESIRDFKVQCGNTTHPDVFKIGIGPGAACETRVKTGVGVPQLYAVWECAQEHAVIADGGCRTPGDVCKALAAGAQAVMMGSMLAGTRESPGQVTHREDGRKYKRYAGSAAGGYAEGWKTSEGAEFYIPYKGSVIPIVRDIEGGLRSSMTYLNAGTLKEYTENAEFIRVSSVSVFENGAHGKA